MRNWLQRRWQIKEIPKPTARVVIRSKGNPRFQYLQVDTNETGSSFRKTLVDNGLTNLFVNTDPGPDTANTGLYNTVVSKAVRKPATNKPLTTRPELLVSPAAAESSTQAAIPPTG